MNEEVNFEARNKLTEYTLSYRYINSSLWYCYIGLDGKLNQLCNYLFCKILDSRMYGNKANSKINENKRIYNDIEITPEKILRDINPNKYSNDEKSLVSDQGNLIRRIRELDDLNIFYYWRCGDYFIFIMERDVGCWKFYNKNGCVTPKTLKKILALSGDMVKFMMDANRRNNIHMSEEEIRVSHGEFLRKMISKMNPLVAYSLPIWAMETLGDYIKSLKESLDGMKSSAGLIQDENFINNLPPSVSKKLEKHINTVMQERSILPEATMIKEIEKNPISSLESELVPENQNIVKKARIRKHNTEFKLPKNIPEPAEVKMYRFDGEVDPFKDTREFMRYYRAFLIMKFSRSIKFDGFQNDAIYAAQILDLLIANKRNDKVFLNGWLNYFYENKLKGLKMYKTKYTSMKALKETFEQFNPLFPYIDI